MSRSSKKMGETNSPELVNPVKLYVKWNGNLGKFFHSTKKSQGEGYDFHDVPVGTNFIILDNERYVIKGKYDNERITSNINAFPMFEKWDKVFNVKLGGKLIVSGIWKNIKEQLYRDYTEQGNVKRSFSMYNLIDVAIKVAPDSTKPEVVEWQIWEFQLKGIARGAFDDFIEDMNAGEIDVLNGPHYVTIAKNGSRLNEKTGTSNIIPQFLAGSLSDNDYKETYALAISLAKYRRDVEEQRRKRKLESIEIIKERIEQKKVDDEYNRLMYVLENGGSIEKDGAKGQDIDRVEDDEEDGSYEDGGDDYAEDAPPVEEGHKAVSAVAESMDEPNVQQSDFYEIAEPPADSYSIYNIPDSDTDPTVANTGDFEAGLEQAKKFVNSVMDETKKKVVLKAISAIEDYQNAKVISSDDLADVFEDWERFVKRMKKNGIPENTAREVARYWALCCSTINPSPLFLANGNVYVNTDLPF